MVDIGVCIAARDAGAAIIGLKAVGIGIGVVAIDVGVFGRDFGIAASCKW